MSHTCRRAAVLLAALVLTHVNAQPPTTWSPRGPGGGGALFAPSINPADPDEYYHSCDMSELYHTNDFAASYEVVPFGQVVGGHASRVCFTNNASVRYCVSYGNWQVAPVKTTNGGATWQALPGNPDPSEETYSVDVDYSHPDRVVVAYYGSIHFSPDGGAAFREIHTARNSGAGVLVAGALFAGDSIFLGTSDGLLVSQNGGTAFTFSTATGIPAGQRILSFTGARAGGVTRLFCITADSGDVYPGITGSDYWNTAKGIYSLDYGAAAWVSRVGNVNLSTDFPVFVDMAENDTSTVYLGGSDDGDMPNVLKTTNAGQTWTPMLQLTNNQNMITGWCGWQGDINWGWSGSLFGLAVCPTDANRVVFTDWGFITKSADGGVTWQQAYTAIADQNPAGAPTPRGRSYHSVGMENTSCWQVFWVDSLNLFAPYTDIKGMRSTDGGASWGFGYTGHTQNTMYWMVQHPQTGILYAATSSIHDLYESTYLQDSRIDAASAAGKVLFSADSGRTWQDLHDFGKPVYWVALDPTNPQRLYASVVNYTQSLGGVYVTGNLAAGAGASWTKLPDPPRTERHPAAIVVLRDSSVVCTYSGRRNASGAFTASSGVFVYSRATQAWTDVSHANMQYWTRDVVVDPFDTTQNTWYVCVYSGWGGPANDLGGVYRTVNRGQSWTRLTSTSQMLSVPSCAINPANREQMFVTSEGNGLWFTNNLSAASPTFTQLVDYPFSHPQRVFFNPYRQSEVWVASFGNGMRVGQMGAAPVVRRPGRTQGSHGVPGMTVRQVAGSLVAEAPAAVIRHVRIVTLNGSCVCEESFDTPVRRTILERAAPGSYLVRVSTDRGSYAAAVVVPRR